MSVSHEIMLLDSTQKLPEHTTFDLFLEISDVSALANNEGFIRMPFEDKLNRQLTLPKPLRYRLIS